MQIKRNHLHSLLALIVGILIANFSTPSLATFHDQGMTLAAFRTDFIQMDKGLASNPLTLDPCIYSPLDPISLPSCFYTPSSYPSSNSWNINLLPYIGRFWVMHMNVEPWSYSLSGPPSQSFPRASPGYGVLGFSPINGSSMGENFYRAHIVLNNTLSNTSLHSSYPYHIPFIGFGADNNRGNGTMVGYTDSPIQRGTVEFTARIWDMWPEAKGSGGSNFMMYAFALWGDTPRMLMVNLYGQNLRWSDENFDYLHRHWSWNTRESFLYPGADIVFIDIDRLDELCGSVLGDGELMQYVGEQRDFAIDLTTSFRCLSNLPGTWDQPMPSGSVPIRGVHWANEAMGTAAALWTSVHDPRMTTLKVTGDYLTTSGTPSQRSVETTPARLSFSSAGEEVLTIRDTMRSNCEKNPACWKKHGMMLESEHRIVIDATTQGEAGLFRDRLPNRKLKEYKP